MDSIQTDFIAIQIPILIGQNLPGKWLSANPIGPIPPLQCNITQETTAQEIKRMNYGNPKLPGWLSFEQMILRNGRELPHDFAETSGAGDYDAIRSALDL